MNFVADVVDGADPRRLALVAIARSGERREWSFGEVSATSVAVAGRLIGCGVRRGDVVVTLVGNRPEWVLTMVACWRIGAVALPCNEQLRGADLAQRLAAASPQVIVCDERNLSVLADAGAVDASGTGEGSAPEVLVVPDDALFGSPAGRATVAAGMPPVDMAPDDPCLITFTSGTSGEPTGIVHGARYLGGQALQAEHWLGARAGDLVWCTAASGWSKSARNAFVAPWLRGAAALLVDSRFDPAERLSVAERERVSVLCMAPTEYRVIAKRVGARPLPALRGTVAAGEALDPETLGAWQEATGLWIRDGYGQTETGQLTGMPIGVPARPGSMGPPLQGVTLDVVDGELVLSDPASDPTFCVGRLDRAAGGLVAPVDAASPWRTGDRVRVDEDGYLYFESRTDDVIISAGYRIGPFEVESALVAHDGVAEAAVVAAPDAERGAVVRAVVVLRTGFAPSEALVRELQAFVRDRTAPYKYPRIVDFAEELPKTASGKVRRALLRREGG